MAIRKNNKEKILADLVSEYIDRLNDGTTPPLNEFLVVYLKENFKLKMLLKMAISIKKSDLDSNISEAKKEFVLKNVFVRFNKLKEPSRKEKLNIRYQ